MKVEAHKAGVSGVAIYVNGQAFFTHESQNELEESALIVIRRLIRSPSPINFSGLCAWAPEVLWFIENQS